MSFTFNSTPFGMDECIWCEVWVHFKFFSIVNRQPPNNVYWKCHSFSVYSVILKLFIIVWFCFQTLCCFLVNLLIYAPISHWPNYLLLQNKFWYMKRKESILFLRSATKRIVGILMELHWICISIHLLKCYSAKFRNFSMQIILIIYWWCNIWFQNFLCS